MAHEFVLLAADPLIAIIIYNPHHFALLYQITPLTTRGRRARLGYCSSGLPVRQLFEGQCEYRLRP